MSDFNRGLEQGIGLGILKERERIIKLLENDFYHFKEITPAIYRNGVLEVKGVVVCADDCSGCDLIALIKGETE